MPLKTARQLLDELRQMRNVAESVVGDDDVEWLVPSKDLSPAARAILGKALSRRQEEDGDAESAAAKHTITGRLEALGERMSGITDFISDGEYEPAAYALEKIIKDTRSLLAEIKRRARMDQRAEKEAQDKEAEQPPPEQEPSAPEQSPQPDKAQRSTQEPVVTNALSGRTPAQPGATAPAEDYYLVNGEVIYEMVGTDPFGLGEPMMEEIRRLSGISPRTGGRRRR